MEPKRTRSRNTLSFGRKGAEGGEGQEPERGEAELQVPVVREKDADVGDLWVEVVDRLPLCQGSPDSTSPTVGLLAAGIPGRDDGVGRHGAP